MNSAVFSNQKLSALSAVTRSAKYDASLTLAKGTPVAKITSAGVNGKVTFAVTGGTPSSGSAQFSWFGEMLTLDYAETTSTIAAKLTALLGAGNYAVTGGPWPGTALVVELKGVFATLTPPTPSLVASTLSAGTAAGSITTTAVPNGRCVAWDPSEIARPTTALSVSATGSGGTLPTGLNMVTYTWANANGETLAAPPAPVTLTSGQQVRVAAINAAGTPDEATKLCVYINGVIAAEIAVASGAIAQTDIAAWSTTLDGRGVPVVSKAFKYTDGRQDFLGFTETAIKTDYKGQIDRPSSQVAGIAGAKDQVIIVGGIVKQADVAFTVGTAAKMVTQTFARILSGTVSGGDAEIAFAPFSGVDR